MLKTGKFTEEDVSKQSHCGHFHEARAAQRRSEEESIENGTSQVEALHEVPRQGLTRN